MTIEKFHEELHNGTDSKFDVWRRLTKIPLSAMIVITIWPGGWFWR